jgi:hypothetical protein
MTALLATHAPLLSAAEPAPVPTTTVPSSITAPCTIPDETAFAVVVVPDLKAAIAHLEAVATAFGAPKIDLATNLGGVFNDPTLAHLASGPCAIIVAPGMPMPTSAFIIPTTTPADYAAAVGAKNMMVKEVGNAVVVAQLFDGLELGEKLIPALPKLATGIHGDVRVVAAPDRIMKAYGAFIGNMMTMAQAMGPAGKRPPGSELLPLYWAGIQTVAAEVATVQMDLGLGSDALTVTTTAAAVVDSALAKATVAPPSGPARAPARLGPDTGAIMITIRGHAKKTAEYVCHVVDVLAQKPETRALMTPETVASIRRMTGLFSDDSAMRGTLLPDGRISMQSVSTASDAAAIEAGILESWTLFQPDRWLGKMYQEMGVTATVTRSARTVEGMPVHRVAFTQDPQKAKDPRFATTMRSLMDSEFASGGGFAYGTQGIPIDSLITQKKRQAATLTAPRILGPNRATYVDMDLPSLVVWCAGFMPGPNGPGNAPLRDAMLKLPAQQPIVMAIAQDAGLARAELHIPMPTLTAVVDAAKKATPPAPPRPPRPPRHDDNVPDTTPDKPEPGPTF